MKKNINVVRDGQNDILDRIHTYEEALLGLMQAVAENTRQIADLHEKLDRLMAHLKVPPKPPAGFVRE